MPDYVLTDSIHVLLNKFYITGIIDFNGHRDIGEITLPRTILVNCQVGYTWKLLNIFGSAENIFDNRYQILPHKTSLGRKFSLGLAIKK
jgi:hypothetical protein